MINYNNLPLSLFLLLIITLSCNGLKSEDSKKEYVFDTTNMEKSYPQDINSFDFEINTTDSIYLSSNANMVVGNNSFFVYGKGTIYCFDSHGNLLNTIGGIGHAENEYTELKDVFINDENKELNVLTYLMIKKYDFNGNLINNVKTDFFATSFSMSNDYFWFYSGINAYYSNYELIRTDKTMNDKKEFLERGYSIPCSNYSISKSPIKAYKYYFSNDIYHIKNDTIIFAYKLKFPNREIPESFGHGVIDEKFAEELDNENFATVDRFFENERYIFILVDESKDKNRIYYHWIIDKKENRDVVIHIGNNDSIIDSYYTNPQFLDSNNILYFLGIDTRVEKDESIHIVGLDLSRLF